MLKFERLFMQNISKKIIALLVFSIILNACRNNSEELKLKGDEYFTNQFGVVKYYQVDTFKFDNFTNKIVTSSFEYKEEITNKLIDLQGDTFYRIELSRYNTIKLKYEIFKVIKRKIVDNYAIENIDNTPQVKMLFPISNYKTKGSSYGWNLNMFNALDEEKIKYSAVFKPFFNGINTYNDCVNMALVKPERGGIVNNIYEEVYAKNIGLVYRHIDKTDILAITGFKGGFEIFVRLK